MRAEDSRYHALRAAGRETEARAAAKHVLELSQYHQVSTGTSSYNVACALAINGRLDEALDLLVSLDRSGALEEDAEHLESDPDMKPIAEHPRFRRLLEHMRAPAQYAVDNNNNNDVTSRAGQGDNAL